MVFDCEAGAQRCIGHDLIRYMEETRMLVAGANFVLPAHCRQLPVREHRDLGVMLRGSEFGSWKLVSLDLGDHFIDPAASLLADVQPAHQSGQRLIARLRRFIDESQRGDQGLPRIGDLDSIRKDLDP